MWQRLKSPKRVPRRLLLKLQPSSRKHSNIRDVSTMEHHQGPLQLWNGASLSLEDKLPCVLGVVELEKWSYARVPSLEDPERVPDAKHRAFLCTLI